MQLSCCDCSVCLCACFGRQCVFVRAEKPNPRAWRVRFSGHYVLLGLKSQIQKLWLKSLNQKEDKSHDVGGVLSVKWEGRGPFQCQHSACPNVRVLSHTVYLNAACKVFACCLIFC